MNAHTPSPVPTAFNMAAHVLRHADALADKIGLMVVGLNGVQRWHYRDIKQAVLGLAQGFLDCGLNPGDRILMRLGNTVEFPITYLAALAVDLVPVPTSSQLTSSEVAKIIDDLEPSLIVHDAQVSTAPAPCPTLDVSELPILYQNKMVAFVLGDPNRLGYIVYTSGTSGRPRAVMHAHRAIWARQMMIRDWYDLSGQDRLLHAGAFNWTFTLGTGLMDPWTVGATALIAQDGTDPFALPLLLKRYDATMFAAAPGVYRKILAGAPGHIVLPKLRHCLSAGEKLAPRIAQEWQSKTGRHIYEAFGMSECSTFISTAPHRPATFDVLGFPQNGRRVAILDPNGGTDPLPPEKPGIIAVHKSDPGLMLGYWNAGNETAEKFRQDWFLTGDYGQQNRDESFQYLGRRDDMMNAGGIRVSPIEVENILLQHPDIQAVAVTDIEIKQDTFVIAAFYVANGNICEHSLTAFCQNQMAAYKVPRLFVKLDQLPQSPNGKILRSALKKMKDFANGHT